MALFYAFTFPLFNRLLNEALKKDETSWKKLLELSGAHLSIEVKLLQFNFPIYISIHSRGFYLSDQPPSAPTSLSISGSLLELGQLIFTEEYKIPALLSNKSNIIIKGDLLLLQELRSLILYNTPLWEECFSSVFGDPITALLKVGGHKILSWKNTILTDLKHDLHDFLIEEQGMIVAREDLEQYYEAVFGLNRELERLEARISKLKTKSQEY